MNKDIKILEKTIELLELIKDLPYNHTGRKNCFNRINQFIFDSRKKGIVIPIELLERYEKCKRGGRNQHSTK